MENENQTKTSMADALATAGTEQAPVATDKTVEAQKGASNQTKEGDKTAEAAKPSKTFSEEELLKKIEEAKTTVKGGYEGTLKQVKEEAKKAREAQKALEAQLEQFRNESFLKQVEGSDIPNGRELAQSILTQRQANMTARMQLEDLREALTAQKADLDAREAELNKAGLAKAAFDVGREYGLTDDETGKLVTAQSKAEMIALAANIALTKLKADKKAPDKPAGDGTTGSSGSDLAKMSSQDKLRLVLEGKLK